jgi:quercetin dioxygenase-like cupin family protein
MFTRVRAAELVVGSGRTARFEGENHGSGVSFFLVDNDPGQGPGLHRHPYTETWVVRAGSAAITADGETVEAVAGDILTADDPGRARVAAATSNFPCRCALGQ